MTSNNTNVCDLIQCPVEYQSICTTDIKSLLYEVTIVTSIVNSLAAIFAVTANTLVIVAIWLTASLHDNIVRSRRNRLDDWSHSTTASCHAKHF